MVNKKAEVIRVYLPPDANTLLSVADHCLRSRDYVNVIVAGKQPAPQWLTWTRPSRTAPRGIGIWEWASNDDGGEPDVVHGLRGRRARRWRRWPRSTLLREHLPDLQGPGGQRGRPDDAAAADASTRTGCPTREFDALFTTDKPVIFAYHGYPWLIHRLTYRRTNHDNLHVRGYKEEGTTTTPFDMVVLNDLDRFHLVIDVIDRVPGLGERAARLRQRMVDTRLRTRAYTREQGEDHPEVSEWRWSPQSG